MYWKEEWCYCFQRTKEWDLRYTNMFQLGPVYDHVSVTAASFDNDVVGISKPRRELRASSCLGL